MNHLHRLNLSDLDIFDHVVKLLNGNSENRVAEALDLFSKVSVEERCRVYNILYEQIPFTDRYWGCAEHAFHDLHGLKSTPEQKAHAIETYSSKLIAAAILNPSDPSTTAQVTHFRFGKCVELFKNGSTKEGMELFAKMSKEQQQGVYKELANNHTFQGSAEDVFYELNGQSFTPQQKALAIENYLIQNIVDLLKSCDEKSAQTALSLFNRMPKEQKERIFEELYKLNIHTHEYWGCAEHVFYDREGQSSTLLQKAEAIQNYVNSQRPAERTPVIKTQNQPSARELVARRIDDLRKAQEQKEKARLEQEAARLRLAEVLQQANEKARLEQEARQKQEQQRLEQEAQKQKELQRLEQQKEKARLEQVAREQRERLRLEQIAEKRSKNINALDQKCIANSEHYYDEPILEAGQCLIRQATTHTDMHPNYTVIFRLPDSVKNDRRWITVDNETGDIFSCGYSFPSLDDLLLNFSVKPVAEFPVQEQQEFREEIDKRLEEEMRLHQAQVFDRDEPKPLQEQEHIIDEQKPLHYELIIDLPNPLLEQELILDQSNPLLKPVFNIDEPIPLPEEKLVATELKLSSVEVAFEQDQAEELFDFGKRSIISRGFVNQLSNYKNGGLEIEGNIYSAITGCTQNFSTTHLASCGSTPLQREVLFLDPNNSPLLAKHYTQFRQTVNSQMTTEQVLKELMRYVRTEIFPSCNHTQGLEAKVDEMVDKASATYPTVTNAKYPWKKIPIIPIDDFIKADLAVCRHHAFVVVYMVDRLLTESNPLIEGTVQHIRGNLDGRVQGAHIWATFIPKRKTGAMIEKWHLDTLWDRLVNFADEEVLKMLKNDYGVEMMDDQMRRTRKAVEANGQIPSDENAHTEPSGGLFYKAYNIACNVVGNIANKWLWS